MLYKRILTALVGIPLTVAIIYYGGLPFVTVLCVLVVLALKELADMLSKNNIDIPRIITYIFGVLIIIQTFFADDFYISHILLIFLIYICTVTVLKKTPIETAAYTIFSIFYIPFLLRYAILLRAEKEGFLLLVLAFILTWSSDTGAFFIGRSFGKRKLCPSISPNKTIEGSLGGIIFTSVAALLLIYVIKISILQALIIGAIISIGGQVGDLFESKIKRKMDVKDSGNILPGHGGILDRFDSVLFTIPIFYLIYKVFII